MTPSDDYDPDQTPAKVIEMLDAMETDEGDLISDLVWDDSIERNAELLVDDIRNSSGSHSRESSIINVDLDDYLKMYQNHDHSNIPSSFPDSKPEDSDHQPFDSSTPVNVCEENKNDSSSSDSNSKSVNSLAKYISSPEHYPSFNIKTDISDDETDHQYSKTRSGKVCKNV